MSGSPSRVPAAARKVLEDLLHELPLDVVDRNVWQLLSTADRTLIRRMGSIRLRQLSTSLITCATLSLHPIPAADDAVRRSKYLWDALRTVDHLPAGIPLQLTSWLYDEDLVQLIDAVSPASRDTTKHLTLRGATQVTAAILSAVRRACPLLRKLFLDTLGKKGDSQLLLPDGVFQPLHGSGLTQLDLEQGVVPSRAALATLCQLTQLRRLRLCLPTRLITAADLRGFALLTLLCQCDVFEDNSGGGGGGGGDFDRLTLQDYAPFLASPHLTALRLHSVRFLSRHQDAVGPAGPAAVVAQLGGLSLLTSLRLHSTFCGNAAFSAAVMRLTQLTSLQLGSLDLGPAPSPPLPLLQRLSLDTSRPTNLLRTLRSLGGLPSLTTLDDGGGVSLGVDIGSAAAAVEESAALQEVVGLLKAAPQLRRGPQLCLHGSPGEQLHLSQALDCLSPLAWETWRLTMRGVRLRDQEDMGPVPWRRLNGVLPRLQHVRLERCSLRAEDLVTLVQRLGVLRSLHLVEVECEGGMEEGHWVQLVAAVPRRLHLFVNPQLAAGIKAVCDAAGPHIVWLHTDPLEV